MVQRKITRITGYESNEKAVTSVKLPFCSNFCNESNGIFVLEVAIFFKQISTFYLTIFDGFFIAFKMYCSPELKLKKKCFACDHFLGCYVGLNIAILAKLGVLTRDIFRASGDLIQIVPIWLKKAYLPFLICY